MQALAPREAPKSQELIAILFWNASVLPRKPLPNRNLFWGLPLVALLPKTRVLERHISECKRRWNANANRMQTQAF